MCIRDSYVTHVVTLGQLSAFDTPTWVGEGFKLKDFLAHPSVLFLMVGGVIQALLSTVESLKQSKMGKPPRIPLRCNLTLYTMTTTY